MPKYSKNIMELNRQLGRRGPFGVELGPVQQEFFEYLQAKNPAFTTPEYIITGDGVRHLQKSRMEKPKPKDKLVSEEVSKIVNSLTASTRIRGVTGKIEHPYAGVVTHGEKTNLGILRPEGGKVAIHTAYAPETRRLRSRVGSDTFQPSSYNEWEAGLPSFGSAGENVKSLLPWTIPGGLLGVLASQDAYATVPQGAQTSHQAFARPDWLQPGPSPASFGLGGAQAGYWSADPPPAQRKLYSGVVGYPSFEPWELLTAPLTAGAGVAKKALSTIAVPFASAATDWATETAGQAIGGLLGKLKEYEQYGNQEINPWPLR